MSDLTLLVEYLTTISENPTFKSDTLILAGNSLPELVISAAKFCEKDLSIQQVIFVGGFGHGTHPLIANCQKRFPSLVSENWTQLSEATIMQQLFIHFCRRDLNMILEEDSTNTGENARFSYQLVENDPPQNFWLVQDPLVQKRTQITFSKEWHLPVSAIQPLCFEQPKLIDFDSRPHFVNPEMDDWWTTDYFLSLVLGEVRRLQDNEQGYGPKGANFIPHIDVPEIVIASYQRCQRYLTQINRK